MKRLTKEQKREIAAIAAKKDEDIDLSGMPEVIDWSGAEVGYAFSGSTETRLRHGTTDVPSFHRSAVLP